MEWDAQVVRLHGYLCLRYCFQNIRCWVVALIMSFLSATAANAGSPNILILLTDDQGFGDLSYYGNPHLKTPAIDSFARESVEFKRFYVSPVCAPTRASLLTGRDSYRTGVTDTWKGMATMHQDEVTLAEVLRQEGYATGLFGKWHLGDTYPYRPQDQGFDTVLMHRGGGIGQPSDPPGNSYFDPQLLWQGKMKSFSGYCMDIYTDKTIEFITAHQNQPFFAFLATNTPHTPLQVPDSYAEPYLEAGLPEETSKIYGMVANIDHNFARILAKLDELGLAENTITIFMSDNGPKVFSDIRHMAGMNGEKTDVLEAGIRSPFFLRWPAGLKAPQVIETIAAHIDLMPTLLDACKIAGTDYALDGQSLMPLMTGASTAWPERTIFIQWHRGKPPKPYRNFAAIGTRWKLLQRNDKFSETKPQNFELYDLEKDPGETRNLADTHPDIVERLRSRYDQWLADVSSTRGYADLPSGIGSLQENPVLLTHQDRLGGKKWGTDDFYPDAYWPVDLLQDGVYTVTFDLYKKVSESATAVFTLGNQTFQTRIPAGSQQAVFKDLTLRKGSGKVTARINVSEALLGPRFVQIKWTPAKSK